VSKIRPENIKIINQIQVLHSKIYNPATRIITQSKNNAPRPLGLSYILYETRMGVVA